MCLRLERPIDLLSQQEFRARFHMPEKISIHLVNGEALSSEKQSHNVMYFRKIIISCEALFAPSFSFQAVHSLHTDPFGLPLSKCCSGADGMQRSRHALPARSFSIGSLVHLRNKDESEGMVQIGYPYSFFPASDRASKLG